MPLWVARLPTSENRKKEVPDALDVRVEEPVTGTVIAEMTLQKLPANSIHLCFGVF